MDLLGFDGYEVLTQTNVEKDTLHLWLRRVPSADDDVGVDEDARGDGTSSSAADDDDDVGVDEDARGDGTGISAADVLLLVRQLLSHVADPDHAPLTPEASALVSRISTNRPRRFHLLRDLLTRREHWGAAPARSTAAVIHALVTSLEEHQQDIDDATWAALPERPAVHAPDAIAYPIGALSRPSHIRACFDTFGLVVVRHGVGMPDIDVRSLQQRGVPQGGDGLRLRVHDAPDVPGVSLPRVRTLARDLRDVVQRCFGAVGAPDTVHMSSSSPALFVNDARHGDVVAAAEALHTDAPPDGARCCYTAIAPLEDGVTLLVVPTSHTMLALHNQHPDVNDIAASRLPLMRVTLQRGDLMVYHGNLAHAADAGVPGRAHPLLRWQAKCRPDEPDEVHWCSDMPQSVRDRLPCLHADHEGPAHCALTLQ